MNPQSPRTTTLVSLIALALLNSVPGFAAETSSSDGAKGSLTVKDQHGDIGIPTSKDPAKNHNKHPDAQWFPDAGLGLFIHWGISSVKEKNISWPMIPGRALGKKRITDPAEMERIIRERDFNLDGKKAEITATDYWALAKDFNPQTYDPEKWCKAAKEAGFTYAVLTTKHHDGFAMWPSAFGEFNTKNYMGGRDLVKPFVEACRKNGLKVGLYYSPPDWYFERDYKNFLHISAVKKNPELPSIDADHIPRTVKAEPPDRAKFEANFDAYVRGQIEELLTRYGKVDVLWFDGTQPTKNASKSITAARIRELQPGIVINPRLHGTGDFITYERDLKTNKIATTWAEFCNTWALLWTYDTRPFRSNAFILGQLAKCRSLGINYLLGIGPDAKGELHPDAYKNIAAITPWMKANAEALYTAKPLPAGESANVPATALGKKRFLFAIPSFNKVDRGPFDSDILPHKDTNITLRGITTKPATVKFRADGSPLTFDFKDNTVTIQLPAAKRTNLVDVVEVEL